MATVGLGQCRGTWLEPALVTAGDDVVHFVGFIPDGSGSYSASDVIAYLLDRTAS